MKRLCFILIFILLLSSCADETPQSAACTLFYENSSVPGEIVSCVKTFKTDGNFEYINDIFSALAFPDDDSFLSPIPSSLKLVSFDVSDGVCTLSLSSGYANMSDVSRTMADSCIVSSLCSLENISRVVIKCSGMPDAELSPESFVLSAPPTYYDFTDVKLYFADASYTSLAEESAGIYPDENGLEYAVVSRLLDGPTSSENRKLIPDGTVLNAVYVADGVCYIDFSSEFSDNAIHTETHEKLLIYSIVNTVTELPMIDRVQFLINGEKRSSFVHLSIYTPFTNEKNIF